MYWCLTTGQSNPFNTLILKTQTLFYREPFFRKRFVLDFAAVASTYSSMETIQQSIYDFPTYYDLVYGSDWEAEFEFLENCFERFTDLTVQRLFEPACGTGRLIYRFGKEGYQVAGVDLNPKAVDFCNQRLEENKIDGAAFVGDMTDFVVQTKADAAFNTINSFRHLNSHEAASNHLKCMANVLNPGGLYMLGLHLTPTAVPPSEDESWIAEGENLQVNTRMWLTERNLEDRYESFAMEFEVYTPEKFLRIEDELVFRTYTVAQFDELLKEVPEFEVVEVFDFEYAIDKPVQVDARAEDVVYVLRKK